MSCHPGTTQVVDHLQVIETIAPPNDPIGNACHTYYIHKDGDIWREVEEQGLAPERPDQRGREGQAQLQIPQQQSVCGNDRMTLIHLPKARIVDLEDPPADDQYPRQAWPNSKDAPAMPPYLANKLRAICTHCDCKRDILWRNFHRADSHFDACFRYHDDGEAARENRCFVKLYTLRVPCIAKKTLIMSMVHHIRVEKNSFVSANGAGGTNKEHMFGLIAGLEVFDLTEVLTRLIPRWQDLPNDHLKASAGLTPKLMVSVILSQYGSCTSRYIIKSSRLIDKYDKRLEEAQESPSTLPPTFKQKQADTYNIRELNNLLIEMNKSLTGAKSIMHYLAASAEILIGRISDFEVYVKSRLEEWDENPAKKALIDLLPSLDCCKEALRDKDKLQIVQKSMVQYMVDIDALHQHIDINLSMVRNLIAEKDKAIQFSIARQASKDSFNMKIIAILTVLFLPGTFMAVLLTTPMFQWDHKSEEPLILTLPTEIYWGSSVSMTLLFAIGLRLIAKPGWLICLVDRLPTRPREYLQKTNAYLRAQDRIDEKDTVEAERAVQRQTTIDSLKSKRATNSREPANTPSAQRRATVNVTEVQSSSLDLEKGQFVTTET